MKNNLLRWSATVSALYRMEHCRRKLQSIDSYFQRLKMVNEYLGGNWVFRLADVVGLEEIKANRPSWYEFYVDDIDRLHCPLDPGAPETEAYLGRRFSDMDMAFYAGMGFDGYCLALQSARLVDLKEKTIAFDKRYFLKLSSEKQNELCQYDVSRSIPKEIYYSAYGDALSALFESIQAKPSNEDEIERLAGGALILLCGGHTGCLTHVTGEIRFKCQMESLIIFSHAKSILTGETSFEDSVMTRKIHALAV